MLQLYDKVDITNKTELVSRLVLASEGEIDTILDYESIIDSGLLNADQISRIQEIIDDEKDHQLIISDIIREVNELAFPMASDEE